MKKGEIYLAEFGKSRDSFEFGKKRPVLIFQTDKLNYAVSEEIYDYFLVIPISTKEDIITNEFRFKLGSRNGLQQESFAVCNSICFIHKKFIKEKIATLSDDEITKIGVIMKDVLDI
jgi:mRNA-degrading endonuclease toxin of MazEF toxin-antitoxin module